jgi:hypothetical protein
MKTQKIIYWSTTGLVAAGMLMSAFMYLSKSPDMIGAFQSLGFPIYFMVILGLAKGVGAVALIAPVADRFKEWAYAGFTFTFVGAIWTHLATSTPWVSPAIFLALLALSYILYIRLKATPATGTDSARAIPHGA